MKHVVVDLEMNPLGREYKKEREVCVNEVIEIGAVLLDENYQEIANFKTYVKPQYNAKIEKKIRKLTGITMDLVANAPEFEVAMNAFFTWCDNLVEEHEEVVLYQWSESDYAQLKKEMELKEYTLTQQQERFFHNWEDFQKEFVETLGVESCISLTKAVHYAGTELIGKEHDALYDAKNTSVLLKTVRDPKLLEKVLGNVIDAFKPSSIDTALGDMFDFSQFKLGA